MKYTPHTREDEASMLQSLGMDSAERLFDAIPEDLRLTRGLGLPAGKTEMEARSAMEELAGRNIRFKTCFRGAGAYRHFVPAAVGHVLSRSEFYTAYTPYQPETSQGILQAIFEYQTMICELTGMDAANASVYDGATAAWEAAVMCMGPGCGRVAFCGTMHPDTLGVVRTYCNTAGVAVDVAGVKDGRTDTESLSSLVSAETACVIVQQPNFLGQLEDVAAIEKIAHGAGAKLVISCNPISLGLLKSPGEWGADIAIGEGQPLGIPMNFGGPYLGFMACKESMQRKLPGRIVGEATDHDGNRGFVLTLQAREQHIRREKASSNICSNEALCALASAVYLSAVGPQGLREAAALCMERAHQAADEIRKIPGMRLKFSGAFFNEFVVESDVIPEYIEKKLSGKGFLSGLPLGFMGEEYKKCMLYCCTEMNAPQEIEALVSALKGVGGK